jgi:hypothetical protein
LKNKIVLIVLLVLLYDRVEYLWYGVNPETEITLINSKESIRADSFIYYASQRVQYIIFAYVLMLLIPQLKRPLLFFFICEVLYFLEYFITYNEPIYKVPMLGDWYIPISVATLKFVSIAYLIVEAVMMLDEED